MMSLAERLKARIKVDPISGCHVWQGPLWGGGYGRIADRPAHRVAYEHHIGPIPAGLDLDHVCRNRACVNPHHLEPVTRQVNLLRGSRSRVQAERVGCCKNGHPYNEENTRWGRDGVRRTRSCRACDRARAAARRAAGLRKPRSIVSRRPDICQGVYCVTGTRVPVAALVSFREVGYGPREIVGEYPTLSEMQVEGALAWWDRRLGSRKTRLRRKADPLKGEAEGRRT